MRIVHGHYPPNYKKIADALAPGPNAIFCYGESIYIPGGFDIPPWLEAHEAVHSRQQRAVGIEPWWDRYIVDPEWRFAQELEAHRMEWRVFIDGKPTRPQRRHMIKILSRRLSGPLYGNIVTRAAARRAIEK